MTRKQIIKIIISVLIAALTALGTAFGLTSCNVVRTVTNRSGHTPSAAEQHTRIVFAETFGRQKHLAFLERTLKGQLELPFD